MAAGFPDLGVAVGVAGFSGRFGLAGDAGSGPMWTSCADTTVTCSESLASGWCSAEFSVDGLIFFRPGDSFELGFLLLMPSPFFSGKKSIGKGTDRSLDLF